MNDTVTGLLLILGLAALMIGICIWLINRRTAQSRRGIEYYGEDWLDDALQRREMRDLTRQAFMNMTEHVEQRRTQEAP